jgi:hypothetical protein
MTFAHLPPVFKVLPWRPLGLTEELWHDPRSEYVERYWLPILGPTTIFLARRLAEGFDYSPTGFEVNAREMALSLGLSHGPENGRHSPFNRTVNRLCGFNQASWSDDVLLVRRRMPPLNNSMISRLPASLAKRHYAEQATYRS